MTLAMTVSSSLLSPSARRVRWGNILAVEGAGLKTPMEEAVQENHPEIIALLKARGA